jgi:hypothetical protein
MKIVKIRLDFRTFIFVGFLKTNLMYIIVFQQLLIKLYLDDV